MGMRPIDYWTDFWSIVFMSLIPMFIIWIMLSSFMLIIVLELIVLFIFLETFILFLIVVVSDWIFPTPYAQTWKDWVRYRTNPERYGDDK
jgi:hypothetical protein